VTRFLLGTGCSLTLLLSDAQAWVEPDAVRDSIGTSRPAAESSRHRDMSDIRRLTVQLRGINSREWSRYGFTETGVREQISGRLSAAGFEVLGPGAALSDTSSVVLEVAVHVNDQAFNNSFLVFLRLKDKLALPNNRGGYVTQTIWSDWRIGGFEPYRFDKLRKAILELIDSFVSTRRL